MKVDLKLKERNKTIWRYLTLEKFLDVVAYGEPRLFLCRLDKLQDAYEKSLTINQMLWMDSNELTDKIQEFPKNYRKKIFINSWNISENELYSLWKTYVGEHFYGIAIKSTPQKIKESIEAIPSNRSRKGIIYIDKVNYDPKRIEEVDIHSFALKKEPYYKTEGEMRIYTKSSGDKFFVPLDLNILIDEIVITPFINDYAKNYFKELVYNYTKENDILMKKISFSQILFNKH